MDFAIYHSVVQDELGRVVPNATVEVRVTETGELARLYSVRDGSAPKANPFNTDANGQVLFFAAGGAYSVKATFGGQERLLNFVAIGTAQEYDIDELAAMLNAGVIFARTRADLNGITPTKFPMAGAVMADATAANNGYYINTGSGGWVFARAFPDTFARLVVTGGDANNVTAAIIGGINPSSPAVFFIDVTQPNTGPVNLTVSGVGTGAVKNVLGNDVVAGEWVGRVMFSREPDGSFKMLNDAESANIATLAAADAFASKEAAAQSEISAAASANAAQGFKDDAEQAKAQSESIKADVINAKDAAETAAGHSQSAAGDAAQSASDAFAYKESAAQSESSASQHADDAAASIDVVNQTVAGVAADKAETQVLKEGAEAAAIRAEAAASSISLPPLSAADKNKFIQVNSEGSAYQLSGIDVEGYKKFGLGSLLPELLAAGESLDEKRPSGLYRVPANTDGSPSTATLLLEEMPFNENTSTQRRQFLHRHSSVDTWTRSTLGGGVQGDWVRMLNTNDLTTITTRRFVNVADYNVPTNGTSDSSVAFNNALAGGNKTVYVPAGTYYFNKYVRIEKNTHLIFDMGAIIRVDATSFLVNGIVNDDNYAVGYSGDGNIHIEGGQFYCLRTSGAQTAFIQIAHARDILVENCVFHSLWRGHFIEYNAVRHGVIRNNYFSGQEWQPTDSGRAAINLDFAYQVGFPTFGAWDGTKCLDIIVEGNIFVGCQTCVDSHGSTAPSGYQYGFIIQNNVFRNSGQHAIWGRWWAEFIISNNRLLGSGDKGILMQDSSNGIIGGNFIAGAAANGDHALQFQQCTDFLVLPNLVRVGANKYKYAYRSFGGSGHRIDTSGAEAGASGVHSVTDTNTTVGKPALTG